MISLGATGGWVFRRQEELVKWHFKFQEMVNGNGINVMIYDMYDIYCHVELVDAPLLKLKHFPF